MLKVFISLFVEGEQYVKNNSNILSMDATALATKEQLITGQSRLVWQQSTIIIDLHVSTGELVCSTNLSNNNKTLEFYGSNDGTT